MRKIILIVVSLLFVSCKNHKYRYNANKDVFIGEDGAEYVLTFSDFKFGMEKK